MTNETILPVDWDWANAQRTLPIFSAVALSLGHDIEVLAPLHQKWRDRPFVEPPKDYALRIAATHQAVRDGTLKSHSTSQAGAPFDVNADFADAQCWEISLLEFRHFCDERGWQVPAEFCPVGYAPTAPAEPPQAVPAESSASTRPGKVWTAEKLAEAKAYREKYGTRKTAAHYQVSEARIRALLPSNKPRPKGFSVFTHRME